MAMKPVALAAGLAWLLQTLAVNAQSITTEAAVTVGHSTDEVSAAAVQLRAFGDLKGGVRFFSEAAWAKSSDTDNDSFSAAYPYTNRLQIIEAYAERIFRPRQKLLGVRAGRFRTPFGIYNASDHAYSGFLQPPLVRYEEYSAVSNNFLEHGAALVAGVPRLTVETALGAPADVGTIGRRSGLDVAVRGQGYVGPFIAGVSHVRTSPLKLAGVGHGKADVTGIDLRWTHSGIQARGEWMTGHPFDEKTTTGWYADVFVHRVFMGPVTAVARVEQLEYEEPDSFEEEYARRQTLGGRIRLPRGFSLNVNVVHRTGELEHYLPTTLDVGLTWSLRRYD